MSSRNQKDLASSCSFTSSDGRRCRSPRIGNHPRFCPDHAEKESRVRAAQKLGKDMDYFFSGRYLSANDLATSLGRLIPAVIRGDVAMGFTFFNAGGDLIQSGKMRALAVTGAKRLTGLSDIPTFKEAGVPEFEYDSWFGILAPASTPRVIVAKVSADIGQVLQAADVKSRFEPQGMVLISSTPEKFDAVIKADTERYSKIIKPAS